MSKTTFEGYVPSLKARHEATIVGGKAIQSKGGSIRYMLEGEYDGRKTLPKTVSKADFESVYGFDAKEAESVIIAGTRGKEPVVKAHVKGVKEKDDFKPSVIVPVETPIGDTELIDYAFENHADTVGSPSPASVEPPAPSEKPFPQEPSNEHFEAFGFGKDEEEEEEVEEPKTKEFTVVLQEGDKLELTDIPDEEEPEQEDDSPVDDEPKEENKDETDENEEDVKESDVLAKVTRPIQEEEEKLEDDEEGSVDLGTVAKVGAIGLTAVALGNVLLAEDEEPFAFNADTDYTDIYGGRAEGSGQIDHDRIDTYENTEVHFRHDYPTTQYEWKTAKDPLTDEEADMVEDAVIEDIGDEPSEGDDSWFVDVDGVGEVGYWKDTDYGEKRFYGLAAEGEDADATVVWELMQQNFNNPDAVRLYYTAIFGDDPHLDSRTHDEMAEMVAEAVQQNWRNQEFINHLSKGFGFEAEDFQKMTPSEFVPFDQMQEELGQMWDETTAPLADAHNYDYEPSNEPSNANFSADRTYGMRDEAQGMDFKRWRKDDGTKIYFDDRIHLNWTQEEEDKWNEEVRRRHEEIEAHEGGTDNLHEFSHIGSYEDYVKEHKAIKWGWENDKKNGFLAFSRYENPAKVGNETWAKQIQELNRYWSDIDSGKYHAQYPIANFSADTVGSPSPSGPSSIPEPAEATGSEPSNEHMEADSKTKNMVIGLTLAGIGISAYLGKDTINKWFDRFGL